MSQRNVPILLLLGAEQQNANSQNNYNQQAPYVNRSPGQPPLNATSQSPPPIQPASPYKPNPILSLISQFQPDVVSSSSKKPIVVDEQNTSPEIVVVDENDRVLKLPAPLAPAPLKQTPLAMQIQQLSGLSEAMQEYIKNFQSNFKTELPLSDNANSQTHLWLQAARNSGPSKTSINSIINAEESTSQPAQAAPEKKKRSYTTKADGTNKRTKSDTAKKLKTEVKTESSTGPKKPGPKSKRKTAEIAISPAEKPSIHPTMTTDKAKTKNTSMKLDKPAVLSLKKDDSQVAGSESENKDGAKGSPHEDKKNKQAAPPIIALNIPLLDPKAPLPGQAEVVVNVLKLAEEKYGWNTIHPNAKSAIDLMDEILDDDDDGADEDDDDELQVVDEKGNALPKKKNNEELTEEQLMRQHETRMNRKVGKYDYEDPFIDDEELQWEEEITTTKEGFFVYWGPLVEDRSSSTNTKKGSTKGKK